MGISTHILDTVMGLPAKDVAISLAQLQKDGSWTQVSSRETDADGRCKRLLDEGENPAEGVYRIRFETALYFARFGVRGLYPYVDIVFEVNSGEEHYHVPLLMTPNGYTTYRGS